MFTLQEYINRMSIVSSVNNKKVTYIESGLGTNTLHAKELSHAHEHFAFSRSIAASANIAFHTKPHEALMAVRCCNAHIFKHMNLQSISNLRFSYRKYKPCSN